MIILYNQNADVTFQEQEHTHQLSCNAFRDKTYFTDFRKRVDVVFYSSSNVFQDLTFLLSLIFRIQTDKYKFQI